MQNQNNQTATSIDTPAGPWLPALGWAAFLASSWTWCIGMFLPVLLLRDFGFGGYMAFAVPNVIGAAAMGWILVRRDSAMQLVRRHAAFAGLFSVVTIAFHIFFLVWMTAGLWLLPRPWGMSALLVAILMILVVAGLRTAWQLVLAGLILVVTWGAAAVLWAMGLLPPVFSAPVLEAIELNRLPQAHLVLFLAVSVFGFALCPYLDLTFNRARASLPQAPARFAFTIGFGVFFLGMILITLAYSGLFLGGEGPPPQLVALHIFVQSAFTVGLHLRALWSPLLPRQLRGGLVFLAAGSALVVLVIGLFFARGLEPMAELHMAHERGLGPGEVIYRVFMGFYGLAFPAYVWLCMIPTAPGVAGPSRSHLRIWAFAVGIAAPMLWMAFIQQQTWWLAPALAIVLSARLLVPKTTEAMSKQGR